MARRRRNDHLDEFGLDVRELEGKALDAYEAKKASFKVFKYLLSCLGDSSPTRMKAVLDSHGDPILTGSFQYRGVNVNLMLTSRGYSLRGGRYPGFTEVSFSKLPKTERELHNVLDSLASLALFSEELQ